MLIITVKEEGSLQKFHGDHNAVPISVSISFWAMGIEALSQGVTGETCISHTVKDEDSPVATHRHTGHSLQ